MESDESQMAERTGVPERLRSSASFDTYPSDNMVSYKESWWSQRSSLEKGLMAGLSVLAALSLVMVALAAYAFLRDTGGLEKPSFLGSVDVCNSSACQERASIILAAMDEAVDPCDDFYSFTCRNWERSHPIPDDRARYGQFDILRIQLLQDLKDIFEQSPYKMPQQQNISDKVVAAYQLCANSSLSSETALQMLKAQVASTLERNWPLREEEEFFLFFSDIIAKMYTKADHMGTSSIFSISVAQDPKNVTHYIITIDQATFGIGRNQLINATSPENKPIVDAYKAFIKGGMKAFDPQLKEDELDRMVENVFNLEAELAKRSRSQEERRDMNSMYHMKSIKELQQEMPDVEWLRMLNSMLSVVNVTLQEDERVLVKEPGYCISTADLLKATNRTTVYNYVVWRMLQTVAPTADPTFRELQFAFHRVTKGLKKSEPTWQKCIQILQDVASDALGRLYVDHKFSAEAKDDMNKLVEELRDSFSLLLDESRWMDKETKKEAYKKLQTMIPKIAYADWLTNDTYLGNLYSAVEDVSPEASFLDILFNFTHNGVVRTLKKIHTFHNRSEEWITGSAIVNAFYDPEANSITFPAGILQSPFYAYGLPSPSNMGAIGVVIGHEITHGFDDSGAQYDDEGNLRDWWSNETRVEFKKKAKCIIDEYGNITDVQANMKLNGENTQGENIADNGGLREAFRAHRVAIAKGGGVSAPALPGLQKYTSDQLFFMSMALVWCTNYRTEELKHLMQYDPHSPGKYRVNIPMGNFDEFSKAFDCPATSRMNLRDKCVLW
ncbi:neprilysin-1-like isoform X2 [Ornithodoros turicata]|uniref:neprilysin-1-like isoform X2 n=1 Tax=Ornithodoros turicata TaxID=34597 RepID=UPI0031390D78